MNLAAGWAENLWLLEVCCNGVAGPWDDNIPRRARLLPVLPSGKLVHLLVHELLRLFPGLSHSGHKEINHPFSDFRAAFELPGFVRAMNAVGIAYVSSA